jgi:hypothetical protein
LRKIEITLGNPWQKPEKTLGKIRKTKRELWKNLGKALENLGKAWENLEENPGKS